MALEPAGPLDVPVAVRSAMGEEMILTTAADMNRLEQAARVSMGEFQDPESPTSPVPRTSHLALRLVAFALITAVLLVTAFHLF